MMRCLTAGLMLLLLVGAWGCEEDLASVPVEKTVIVKTGDAHFVKAENDVKLDLLEAELNKKGKKRTFTLTSSGELTFWAYFVDLTLKMKVKDKKFTGLKKKGNKCIIRNMVDGFPKIHKFKVVRSESRVGGAEGDKVVFRILCKQSKKYKDQEGYGEDLPSTLWVHGSVNPSWTTE